MGRYANTASHPTFWKRFDDRVMLVPFSACHYWTGSTQNGYGEVTLDGKKEGAHRVSFLRRNGYLPDRRATGALVRHTCDQPLCVNPDHLIVGTQADNMIDKQVRGRAPRGEKHVCAKLSNADVEAIKARAAAGEQTGELAKAFRVSKSLISAIRHGNADSSSRASGVKKPTGRTDRRVSDDIAREMYRGAVQGDRVVEIANDYGVRPGFIYDIRRGNTYASVSGFGGR